MIAPISTSEVSIERNGTFHSVFVWLTSSAGALGCLLFGYDWVVIGRNLSERNPR
jgi:hypothetical protein